ncbi:hypothetical protein AB1Y20_002962 [Prymnesium parvum]|uniref:Class I SAM-dependent methyltransferase n=1 Tax=Prymnesium parvum TaxID=97485 RepID=A0AB34JAG2_PRYPA
MTSRWRLAAAALRLWPDEQPDVAPFMHGWVHLGNERLVRRLIASRRPRVLVELGSWLGLFTTFLLEETELCGASVFAVDPWDAARLQTSQADQYAADPEARRILADVPLYATFLANTWPHRHRLFPLRMTSLEGLAQIERLGAPVDLVYIDGDHSLDAVLADLEACHALFPEAAVVGDDWQWPEVRQAVRQFCTEHPMLQVVSHPRENWWYLETKQSEIMLLRDSRDVTVQRHAITFVHAAASEDERNCLCLSPKPSHLQLTRMPSSSTPRRSLRKRKQIEQNKPLKLPRENRDVT